MSETHELMDGRIRLYQRPRSRLWQCATYLNGKEWRSSTRQESIARAKDVATDWYLELLGKHRTGNLKSGKTFAEAADKFLPEYELLTQGQRNERYVKQHGDRLRVHLLPFFGDTLLPEITSGMVQDWDGSGVCLFAKRLEEGKFCWPRIHDGVMRLSAAQLGALVEGLDWKRVHVQRIARPQAVQ